MTKPSIFVLVMAVGVALFFTAGTIGAATTVSDVIKMENKKGLVAFAHKKHNEEYKINCGECHHDANGKPLSNLKMGDDVKGCIECHKEPGEMPGSLKKEMKENKASKKEIDAKKMEYKAEAMHANCVDCHKSYNKTNGLKKNDPKAAPEKSPCSGCHQAKDKK